MSTLWRWVRRLGLVSAWTAFVYYVGYHMGHDAGVLDTLAAQLKGMFPKGKEARG